MAETPHPVKIRRRLRADGAALPENLHPVLARVYAGRRVRSAAETECVLSRLHSPAALSGLDQAVTLLAQMLRERRRILFVADFDADGATACALGVRALQAMGAADVRYVVPNRFEYGYGLTPEIVSLAAEQKPDLIVTVDNGIASVAGVRAARERGIRVLVTDHHLPGPALPPADAIVNPNLPGDAFPSKHLAGVGVIFYVVSALRAHLRETGWFENAGIDVPNLAGLLDLVALGTVADVVPLDHNNRILVAQGLKRINQGRACAGITALLRVAGRRTSDYGAMDLGFMVAPRLNAAGRLDDMSLGIACLLTDDPAAAESMASQLDRLNRERRAIEAGMQEQALAALDVLHLEGNGLPKGLCLFEESWHQGVIGLVAARIRERLHRPVIAFAPAGNDELKGSARSVPGLHIRDALDAVAARHPHLLQKFGGHAMAAGLSLNRAHFQEFSAAFEAEVDRHLDEDDLQGRILTDGELEAADLDLGLAELLRSAGPWGQGFPEPLFDNAFEITACRVVGERHLKLLLRHPQGKMLDGIAFNQAQAAAAGERIRAVYRLDVNEYQGQRSLQLVIEYMERAVQHLHTGVS